jgi:hypothetical protein
MNSRSIVNEFTMEPGTGKAIELLQGQILRVEQIEGGQCADFNCFNLHDYKEFMHTGRTRVIHGMHITKGHFLWSAPPRERPMMYIMLPTTSAASQRTTKAPFSGLHKNLCEPDQREVKAQK